MNTKLLALLSLALFAFGIGISMPSQALTACQAACNENFRDCLDAGIPIAYCNPDRSRCLARCH
ncbi:MAG: hypothetical protein ABIQ70_14215 [Dokdonella sp.]